MRRAGSQAEPNESATQVQCDALQQSEVQAVFEQVKPSVVISSVGGSPQDPSADSDGNINLINAALNAGTQRFVLVSSIGAGESKQATPEQVYSALEPVLIEKEKAEARLTELQSHMSFTVLRPGGLKSDGRTNNATITEDTRVIGSINRQARSWIGIGYFSDWLNVVD
jgi:nucleoside-diphosphate-sugar epimerase